MNWRVALLCLTTLTACGDSGNDAVVGPSCERTGTCDGDAAIFDGGMPTDVGLLNDADVDRGAITPLDGAIQSDAAASQDEGVGEDPDHSLDQWTGFDADAPDLSASPDSFSEFDASMESDTGPMHDDQGMEADASPIPDFCANGQLDEDEQEVDCGGRCPPCVSFVECTVSDECLEGTCLEDRCVPTHCDDGIQNHEEEGVDCGADCGQCPEQGCLQDIECARGRCTEGVCIEPICGNGVIDGDEECDDGNPYRFDGCLPDCTNAGPQLCTSACSKQGTMMVPSGQFEGRLTRDGGTAGDGFGLSLAKSNDQVFVGAPFSSREGRNTGTVSVFKKQEDGFVAVELLQPRDQSQAELFGASISADRDTLLIGAPLGVSEGEVSGVVYVYRRRGGESWVQVQRLVPSTPTDGLEFGQGDMIVRGDTLVIGAPNDSENGPESGAVYLYRRGGDGRFAEVQKVVPADGAPYSHFGSAVAYEDGMLLVGAPALQSSPSGYGRYKGAAYLFGFDGTEFSQVQKLEASGPASLNGFNFGAAVMFASDSAFITAPREDFNAAQSGVVYVYRRHLSGQLAEDQKFGMPESEPGSLLGMSITRHKDFLLIGQPFRRSQDGLNNAGAVVVFQQLDQSRYRFGGVWENAFAARNAFYGSRTIALDETVLVSTHGDAEQGTGAGAITLVRLRAPICDLFGNCICEDGAEGEACETLTLCGDGIVQEAEACDTAIFSVACEPGCILPNCSDGQQNGNETDVDCGGGCGSTCAESEVCVTDLDCLSRSCGINRLCEAPRCDDGIQNGDECDIDCGTVCPGQPCLLGQYCFDNTDCESGVCGTDGRCKPMRRLDGPVEAEFERFGAAVAIDDDRMIVGAPDNQQLAESAGAAYVYARTDSGRWVQEGMLLPPDIAAQMQFGSSVAIDGDVAVVGAPGTQLPNSFFNTGAAFVFKRQGNQWLYFTRLVADDGPYSNEFGASVAIEGGYIVVGATGGRGGPRGDVRDAGSAHVFTLGETGAQELTKLYDNLGSASSRFGNALALDDGHLAVGSEADNFGAGAVLLYRLSEPEGEAPSWQLERKVTSPINGQTPKFGAAVDIEGDQLVIGAPETILDGLRAGKAYLYERHPSGTWLTLGEVAPSSPTANGRFGYAVSRMGPRVLVSEQPLETDPDEAIPEGSVYSFTQADDGNWVMRQQLQAPAVFIGTHFGSGMDVDGQTLIIGAPGGQRGSIYLYGEELLPLP